MRQAARGWSQACHETQSWRCFPLSPRMEPARAELAPKPSPRPSTSLYVPSTRMSTLFPTDPAEIKANLVAQLTAPVRWTQTVRNMIADGAAEFVELGPGKGSSGILPRSTKPLPLPAASNGDSLPQPSNHGIKPSADFRDFCAPPVVAVTAFHATFIVYIIVYSLSHLPSGLRIRHVAAPTQPRNTSE